MHNKNSTFNIKILVVTLSVLLTACTAISGRESAGQYLDDTTITSRVKTAILQDPKLKFLEISVETFKNEVQLSGFVSTQQEKMEAQRCVRNVPGVNQIKNNIIVRYR